MSDPLLWNTSLSGELILSCMGSKSLEKILFYSNKSGQLGVQGSVYVYDRVYDRFKSVELGSRGVLDARVSFDGMMIYALVRDREEYRLFSFDGSLNSREQVFHTKNSSQAECLSVCGDGDVYSTTYSHTSYDGNTLLDVYNANGRGVLRDEDDVFHLFEGALVDYEVSVYGDFLVASVSDSLISRSRVNQLVLLYVGSGLDSLEEVWVKESDSPALSVALSLDEEYVAAGYQDNRVCLYDLDGFELFCYRTNWSVASVDVSVNGEYVAAYCRDRNLYILDRTGSLIWRYKLGSPVNVVLSDDGDYLAACSAERVLLFRGPALTGH